MKIAEILANRRVQWQELDRLCGELEQRRRRRLRGATVARFATLYRSACADLALADAYHLPPNTVQYLHQLVGRAHSQLYRSRTFDYGAWAETLLIEVPQRIFHDGCVQLVFVLFWGAFVLSAALAAAPDAWPDYAQQVLGDAQLNQLESNFSEPIAGRNASYNPVMASFYIYHNTGIGLYCFAGGLLVLPGLLITVHNAVVLGASFGYMARPDVPAGVNFFHFVTAHGPFELTAIVLSAGAGLRLGLGWIKTRGMTRLDSLRRTAHDTMPLMGMAMLLFFLAAMIEAFLSPSAALYLVKAVVAVICSGLLMFYFVVLGYPRESTSGV
jgi:uncharacterized membrane protein SpoIIM required for sporulation